MHYDSAPMARPRTFNEGTVVQAALQTFWRQGYASTSIPDLLSATNLHRGSLYKAFGDKHSLFERALETYLETERRAMRDTLQAAESPLAGITRWMSQVSERCSGKDNASGCLAVNAMVELGPADDRIRERLTRHWTLVGRQLAAAVEQAQAAREVRIDVPAPQLAEMVVLTVTGIAVFARQGETKNVVPTVLALLSR